MKWVLSALIPPKPSAAQLELASLGNSIIYQENGSKIKNKTLLVVVGIGLANVADASTSGARKARVAACW